MTEPRDAAHWADPVSRLEVADVPVDSTAINVEGRRVVGTLQGFGQMWQRTYRVRLSGAVTTPWGDCRSALAVVTRQERQVQRSNP